MKLFLLAALIQCRLINRCSHLLHSFDHGFTYMSGKTSTVSHYIDLVPEEKSVGLTDYRLRYEKLV